jgi:hypothetical protein
MFEVTNLVTHNIHLVYDTLSIVLRPEFKFVTCSKTGWVSAHMIKPFVRDGEWICRDNTKNTRKLMQINYTGDFRDSLCVLQTATKIPTSTLRAYVGEVGWQKLQTLQLKAPPEYAYIATDGDGTVWLYHEPPVQISDDSWGAPDYEEIVPFFIPYRFVVRDWKKSLRKLVK